MNEKLEDQQHNSSNSTSIVRKFIVPQINIQAKSNYQLSSLKLKHREETPVTKELVNEDVEAFQENKILQYPCHNQAVKKISN